MHEDCELIISSMLIGQGLLEREIIVQLSTEQLETMLTNQNVN